MTRPREGFKGGLASLVVVSGSGGLILVYNGVPAAGTLIFSIASAAGTDPYGNTYPQGVGLISPSFATAGIGTIFWDIGGVDGGRIRSFGAVMATRILQLLGPGSLANIAIDGSGTISFIGNFQNNAGIIGKYHNEENTFSVSATSLTSVSPTSVSNVELHSDYGTGFSGGTFSAPVHGIYSAHFNCNDLTDNVARSSVAILRNGTIIARTPLAANAGFGAGQALSVSASRFELALNDQLTFQLFNGAATKTVTGTIWVGRHT